VHQRPKLGQAQRSRERSGDRAGLMSARHNGYLGEEMNLDRLSGERRDWVARTEQQAMDVVRNEQVERESHRSTIQSGLSPRQLAQRGLLRLLKASVFPIQYRCYLAIIHSVQPTLH